MATTPQTTSTNTGGIMGMLQPLLNFIQGNLLIVGLVFVVFMMTGKKKQKGQRVTASRLTKNLYKKVARQRGNRQQPVMMAQPQQPVVYKVQPNIKYA